MSPAGDAYSTRALDFIQQLQQLRDYEEIRRHILKEMQWFGFSCVTSFSVPTAGQTLKDCLWLNNRPQDYIDHYSENNTILHDPIVTEFRTNIHPYTWGEVRAKPNLKKKEKNIIDEAREWGARDGFMVPIVTRSGSVSGFCPCGFEPDLSPRARAALEIIAIYSHHALTRAVLQDQRKEFARTPLTAREREVLQWVAAGKTDDEIADILSLGTSTVASHVENAKRKLDAFRRTYAVVQALRLGEISI
jgi:LuxR family quorum sensing-dependent transcriptional regulator